MKDHVRKMDQGETPLIDAITRFRDRDIAYFNIPSHRFARGVDPKLERLLGKDVFRADFTETDGLDDLHDPHGAIRKAQQLAADLFGSEDCWFLVNGTTCANEAMILSCVSEGEKILIARNAHKSALMGLILSGAVPVWVDPEYDPQWKVYGEVKVKTIEDALVKHPDVKAVFLTSPTYYGVCSDLKSIAECCHARRIPLLVDEAHGAHFYFHDRYPEGALDCGADLVSQSIHKTAGGMTQASVLQRQGTLTDRERVNRNLKLVQSTSPSYVLMASLDGARHFLAVSGTAALEEEYRMGREAEAELQKIEGVRVMRKTGSAERDPGRVVFSARDIGISGTQMQEALFRHNITTEMADPENVVLVITWANTGRDLRRLVRAVREICAASGKASSQKNSGFDAGAISARQMPVCAMTPRQAWMAQSAETCRWEDAAGRVSGETAAPYPPGIPILYPGEVITEEIIKIIQTCRRLHIPVHGLSDRTLHFVNLIPQAG